MLSAIEILNNSGIKAADNMLVCPKHGPYKGWTMEVIGQSINSICDKCVEEEAEHNRQQIYSANLEVQKRLDDAKRNSAFNNSCIPPKFMKKSIKDFIPTCKEMEEVLKMAKDYIIGFDEIKESGRSFLFSGNSGTGKTHLATAIANNVIRMGYTAVYVNSLNYLSKVKTAWNFNAGISEDEIVESYVKPDLLLIDDLGKGTLDAKEKGMIFRLIIRREEEGKPMIGITSLTEQRLCDLIDIDSVRRLKTSGGRTIRFDWKPFES
jgi:DNA replication protein DnaC